jgi:excinuclease ABC subunit B
MSKLFSLQSPYKPSGDQGQAIQALSEGVLQQKAAQVLLGVTGSGKTFSMAHIIENVQMPTLILAHNKTLAAQLYQEFHQFFPNNAVEYFVSYYDYYQPEAYIARTDTYIEKDLAINDRIDRMRLSATRSLIERKDVIIVSSVSCIYGLGMPEYYMKLRVHLSVGDTLERDDLLLKLVEMQYSRNDIDFARGSFRVRGDVVEVFPAYEEKLALRIEFFGDEVDRLSEIDPLTGHCIARCDEISLYPSSHHVTPEDIREKALDTIKTELDSRINFYKKEERHLERERIQQRTSYDMEMIREVGTCKGVENYSRHFTGRNEGDPPPCLLDYFPKEFLLFIDESHQTIPQVHAMYNGDRARKTSLIDFGFRLPSAYDNRPLKFQEFYNRMHQVIYVSATPGVWEVQESEGVVVEQIIRPTGLLDPIIEMRPASTQVDDCLAEIHEHTKKGGRVLVTTLTKRLAEELTSYLCDLDIKAKYLHSDIDTIERMQIIRDLRSGGFDVLVGINLLREGLDIPEVSLVAILDADKEGFLRSATALIQTCGRAARNVDGRVIMYADKETKSIKSTLEITRERRSLQESYNKKHNIVPRSVKREITSGLIWDEPEKIDYSEETSERSLKVAETEQHYLTMSEVRQKIKEYKTLMEEAAKNLSFEDAAKYRDLMRQYEDLEMTF